MDAAELQRILAELGSMSPSEYSALLDVLKELRREYSCEPENERDALNAFIRHTRQQKWHCQDDLKRCPRCHEWKPFSEYYNDRHKRNGCSTCCKQCVCLRANQWTTDNPEKRKEYMRKYRERNGARINERRRARRNNNPQMRLARNIGTAMRDTLKHHKAGRPWESLVGYTEDDLRRHLEAQFQPGMTWDNYGKDGWHMDHIIPVSVFSYNRPEDIDFQRCWAMDNLQPLWAHKNLSKGAKLERPFQPCLAL